MKQIVYRLVLCMVITLGCAQKHCAQPDITLSSEIIDIFSLATQGWLPDDSAMTLYQYEKKLIDIESDLIQFLDNSVKLLSENALFTIKQRSTILIALLQSTEISSKTPPEEIVQHVDYVINQYDKHLQRWINENNQSSEQTDIDKPRADESLPSNITDTNSPQSISIKVFEEFLTKAFKNFAKTTPAEQLQKQILLINSVTEKIATQLQELEEYIVEHCETNQSINYNYSLLYTRDTRLSLALNPLLNHNYSAQEIVKKLPQIIDAYIKQFKKDLIKSTLPANVPSTNIGPLLFLSSCTIIGLGIIYYWYKKNRKKKKDQQTIITQVVTKPLLKELLHKITRS